MGKKKDKAKGKQKEEVAEESDRPGRKELAREVERLKAQNEALRARLDRIAEIAAADRGPTPETSLALVLDEQES